MTEHIINLAGRLDHSQEKSYAYLPFDVPPDAALLEVTLAYSDRIGSDPHLVGGNTIDLGVFDERGIEFLNAGFRGFSGSERLTFYISPQNATPGYLPGPILPGRWHAMLGLYKLAPQGCHYQATIRITTEDGSAATAATPAAGGDLPASRLGDRAGPWLCGELHCHSWHSDGDASAADVVAIARERGLDFLAITDHNTIASQRELASLTDPGLVLIRGVEVTTFRGHLQVLGIPDWVDFRALTDEAILASARFAAERGALLSCNHPKPFGPNWEFTPEVPYDGVEVWNGPWAAENEASLAYWVRELAKGRRLTALAGSDYHRREELHGRRVRAPGTPATWVAVPGEASARAILGAIRQGHVSLSNTVSGPFLELTVQGGEGTVQAGDNLVVEHGSRVKVSVRCLRGKGRVLTLHDQEGVRRRQEIERAGETVSFDAEAGPSRYLRAELRDHSGEMQALTNPVYLQA
jgi:hypothetical protein